MKKFIIIMFILLSFTGCANDGLYELPAVDYESEATESIETISVTTTEAMIDSTLDEPMSEIPSGNYSDRFLFSNDSYMDYWLYIPKNATTQMPLVVFLHGIGEVGRLDALENYGMIQRAHEIYDDEFPFIALNPCVQTKSWTYGQNPEMLKALIDHIIDSYDIDPGKIILTGHSLGSIGTWYMLSLYGDYFSAAVPVSCGCDELLDYPNMAQVPILAFCGDTGEYECKYANGMQRIIGCVTDVGGTATLTILPGMTHEDTVTQAYNLDVFEWMLSQ